MNGVTALGRLPVLALEVVLSLSPLIVVFVTLQVLFMRLPREFIRKVIIGVTLTALGLTLFLFGVERAYLPAGQALGSALARPGVRWAVVPLGLLLGFLSVLAEPAVRVLGMEVDRASGGIIQGRLIVYALCTGVAVFIAIGLYRAIVGLPLRWILVPGYLIGLALIPFSDPAFVPMAFDAGGVATGPMIVTFILPMALGLARATPGRTPIADGMGIIALIALAPILAILILGVIFRLKGRSQE